MIQSTKFYKNKRTDKIWWIDTSNRVGEWLFSFDKRTVFNLFTDYPYKLTAEQKAIFDKENPFWAEFFQERGDMPKIKITVMRQTVYTDLMAQYENPIEHACDLTVGQTFVVDRMERPEGLF